jgi:hypothetical protein
MRYALILGVLFAATTGNAQWEIQPAPTTADLRGIDNVGKGIAWASGSDGTVLHTTDDGAHWQLCPTPPDAEKLDFRGIQAFDEKTAIVMSTGKGPLSRLYKTTDGCQTWTLSATNPEKDGFFDAVQTETDSLGRDKPAPDPERAMVLGDSVDHKVQLWEWQEGWNDRELELHYYMEKSRLDADESSFAASNSVLQVICELDCGFPEDHAFHYRLRWSSGTATHAYIALVRQKGMWIDTVRAEVPMSQGVITAGIFSFSFRDELVGVAVGGDLEKPVVTTKTAAFTTDAGNSWALAQTPPHGFRSAVAYDEAAKTWITVGPNGTDISTDDGRNWRALRPNPALHEPADADRDWNALSLPFVVGPHGRIGKLRPTALK